MGFGGSAWSSCGTLGALVLLASLAAWQLHKSRYSYQKSSIARAIDFDDTGVLVTKKELGQDNGPLLLSIVGHVFDVSAGAHFYGPGKPYGSFARRDATRAFATGDFESDLTESIEGLSEEECSSILSWLGFYKKSSKYHFVGYIRDGAFFDIQEDGCAKRSVVFHDLIRCARAMEQIKDDAHEKCSARFDLKQKMHTKKCSPGISVPRRALISGEREYLREKCICVPVEEAQSRKDVQLYPECDPSASQCAYAGDLSESEL